jgi:hypothetical protein
MGPTRASLLQIGFSSVQVSKSESTFLEELNYISPYVRALAVFRGYHWLCWVLCLVFGCAELAFFGYHIYRTGRADSLTVMIIAPIFVFLAVNAAFCFKTAFVGEDLTADTPIDAIHLSGAAYLQLKGLDTLARAQQRMARESNKQVSPETDFGLFKQKLVSSLVWEVFTVHLVPSVVVGLGSGLSTIIRSYNRGDSVLLALAVGSTCNKLVWSSINAHTAFSVRLVQRLAEFEIRRVEADVRTITPNLIHRITPRFKSLLHECHMFGNISSGAINLVALCTIVNMVQLVLAIMSASFGDGTECVPAWTFAGAFQPIISLLFFVHNFGLLNLAIERDIDQDVVEMNIRCGDERLVGDS